MHIPFKLIESISAEAKAIWANKARSSLRYALKG
jgi:hypothetical protein